MEAKYFVPGGGRGVVIIKDRGRLDPRLYKCSSTEYEILQPEKRLYLEGLCGYRVLCMYPYTVPYPIVSQPILMVPSWSRSCVWPVRISPLILRSRVPCSLCSYQSQFYRDECRASTEREQKDYSVRDEGTSTERPRGRGMSTSTEHEQCKRTKGITPQNTVTSTERVRSESSPNRASTLNGMQERI